MGLIIFFVVLLALFILYLTYRFQSAYRRFMIKRKFKQTGKALGLQIIFIVLAQICSLIIAI